MTAGGITQTVRHRAETAGLAPLGPQDLRRTAIHELVEASVNLTEVHHRFGFVSHVSGWLLAMITAISPISVGRPGSA